MYPVNSNFHSLSTQDAPKTRARIYFIDDTVDCTNDSDVQTNGTLLVWAAGDTDSNGRVGDDGIRWQEYFNRDKNIEIGAAVSSQIEIPLINVDGALNNFSFGRCKVYLDVYDTANSAWRVCPMGVYIIDLPTKRRVKLISASGYDQMQLLDTICDSWWSGLNWSGGITLSALLTSMANQLGVKVSTATASAILNSSVSYTEAPFACVEVTYREVLEYIAEATGTIARFDRDGYLDLRFFSAAQIGGNTVTINADTVGNTCLDIDIAEYQAAAIDLLKVKIAEDDIGVTVGSGTNQYTIVNNLFLYGSTATIITNRATPIYNRLNGLGAYTPIQAKLIYDWSLEAGDIINIVRDSTTYPVLIFQQTLTWRGGYVTADILADGDNVRPVMDYDERASYRMSSEMSKKVGDNEIISKINQTAESIQIQASRVDLAGYVTFTNLSTSGQTTINGGNITTGTIDASTVTVSNINASNISSGTLSAARIGAGSITANKLNSADINASKILTVGSMTDAAAATVLNSNIAIGGRNIATGTATAQTLTTAANQNWFNPSVYTLSAYSATALSDASNTQVTVSFDYSITGVDTAFPLTVGFFGGQSYTETVIAKTGIPIGSSTGHAEATKDITNNMRQYAHGNKVLFSGSGNANASAVLTVSNFKVEIGNKATSWTQAPEDVADDIATAQSTAEGANSQEQLIYISKTSGTTTQSATTTWVTNTTGNQNTWTIKRPTYNSSYPVLFVATQRKNVAGTVTCTTPQIDNTTTVIDGGHITTGTIDASVVNVTNLNASNITSGTMSASKISGGTLTLGGANNTDGTMTVKDANGNTAATVTNTGITVNGSQTIVGDNYPTTLVIADGGIVSQTNGENSFKVGRNSLGGGFLSIYKQINGVAGTINNAGITFFDGTKAKIRYDYNGFIIRYDNGYGVTDSPAVQLFHQSSTGSSITFATPPGDSGYPTTIGSAGSTFGANATFSANATVNGVLDVTNRRTNAVSLSTLGWYRAIRIATDWRGGRSFAVDICIGRNYSYTKNEIHKITLLANYDSFSFVNEISKSNTKIISAIRYTHDSNNGYIDIQYSSLSENNVYVDFDVHCHPENRANFTAESLQSVADSPSGETVLTEYTFVANNTTRLLANATKDSSFNATPFILNCIVYLQIGIMVVTYNIWCPALSAGVETLMGTFPDGYRSSFKENFTICGQSGNPYLLQFYTDGRVTIYSNSASTDQFIRGTLTLPLY